MCFSAPVSFAASGVIGAIGIATLAKVKDKKEIPWAIVPLVFALHQFIEGIIWITPVASTYRILIVYAYLFIAVLLWPILFPIASYLIEDKRNKIRRKILIWLFGLGIIVSLISLIAMIFSPVSVSVVCDSLSYYMTPDGVAWQYVRILQVAYVIAGVGCMFISSHKFINFFGLAFIISFISTYISHYEMYFSVWCFFAALLSMSIFFFFVSRKKKVVKINAKN